MKIYFVRHQAGGVLHGFPFSEPPTAEQMAPILAACDAQHGERHPKTGEKHWTSVVAIEVIEPGMVPAVMAERPSGAPSGGELSGLTAHGVGHVKNPE